ncbi:MAG TPA: hypothetical protein VF476_13850, partial [Chitinophagaceae bacterium]
MKKNLQNITAVTLLAVFTILVSCSRKVYTASNFEEQTTEHRVVAVVPAEMIFTGTQPKNMTEEDIAKLEEAESIAFQQSLYNNILRYANTNKYVTTVNFQDITTTQKILEQKNISARASWKMTDKDLSDALGVDAVVRMRIRKQRYMSDAASYGIDVAKQVIYNTGIGGRIPVPSVRNKTNDIITSCSLVSDGQTLWNDNYTRASDHNTRANDIIESITENFGRHFPYK